MSGVLAVRYLLANYSTLTAIVPAARIMTGELPLNTALPAIGVSQVDSMPMNYIQTNTLPKMHTDRVQVSVLCKEMQSTASGVGYVGVKTLLRLALAACPNQRATINNILVDSIVPDFVGPDAYDDVALVHQGSRDLIVRWMQTS